MGRKPSVFRKVRWIRNGEKAEHIYKGKMDKEWGESQAYLER